jgi:hypothetical protein
MINNSLGAMPGQAARPLAEYAEIGTAIRRREGFHQRHADRAAASRKKDSHKALRRHSDRQAGATWLT